MQQIDAFEFATGRGLEELKARMAMKGTDPHVGADEKAILEKFFADQGLLFVNRDDKKILDFLKGLNG